MDQTSDLGMAPHFCDAGPFVIKVHGQEIFDLTIWIVRLTGPVHAKNPPRALHVGAPVA